MNYASLLGFKDTVIHSRKLRQDLRLRFPGIRFDVVSPELRRVVIRWHAGPSEPLVIQVAKGLIPGSTCLLEPHRS